jgi:Na+-driven multidrug efflux pump
MEKKLIKENNLRSVIMLKRIKESLELIDYNLYSVLLLMGLIPTLYSTVKIFFLGQMPNSWGYNIASQLMWVNVIYEVIQEGLILPLYHLLGSSLKKKSEFENKIKTGSIVIFSIFLLLSVLVSVFVHPLINLMKQDSILVNDTAIYIRLETIAKIFSSLFQFYIMIFNLKKRTTFLYLIIFIQIALTIIFDIFLVSSFSISLKLGVKGIAYSNILVNLILLVSCIIYMDKTNLINLQNQTILDFKWFKEWFKIGLFSGLESFVRNFFFLLMIVRMTNIVGEQGTFWVTNTFIWSWLLLPILQFGELIKRDCGEDANCFLKNEGAYFSVTAIVVLLWIVSIPVWKPFIRNVMNVQNYEEIYRLSLISLGFYIVFAFNNVIDSIFYGIGKTQYLLVQSLIINILFYGTFFILYLNNIYKPTLMSITLMFGSAIAADGVVTFIMYGWYKNKVKKEVT